MRAHVGLFCCFFLLLFDKFNTPLPPLPCGHTAEFHTCRPKENTAFTPRASCTCWVSLLNDSATPSVNTVFKFLNMKSVTHFCTGGGNKEWTVIKASQAVVRSCRNYFLLLSSRRRAACDNYRCLTRLGAMTGNKGGQTALKKTNT